MKYIRRIVLLFLWGILLTAGTMLHADDGYNLWLKYEQVNDDVRLQEYQHAITSLVLTGDSKTAGIIRKELSTGLNGLLGKTLPVNAAPKGEGSVIIGTPETSDLIRKSGLKATLDTLGSEGYVLRSMEVNHHQSFVITANTEIGLLYGAFGFLRTLQTGKSLRNLNVISKPKIQYRLLDHWDNLNRTVERGYAGKSLWKWEELPDKVDPRYSDYARANASIGINGAVLNNVNANPEILKPEYLKKVAKLANVFRPYGIRVFLSANFSSPISAQSTGRRRRGGIGDLSTADPLDPAVRKWWKDKVKEIYQYIPDFGGFLVKANSEGMPGPQDFNRTHAQGANMLAEALEPYGGVVMWRAFVYNPDVDPDRAKRAYKEFVPLDGKFLPNVFVQAKNGPIDFQPREPVQPLFGAMPKTPLMMELQITQEYLGQSTHLVFLASMWKEYFEFDTYAKGKGSTVAKIIDGTLHGYQMTGIAGVANTGSDRNWTGHLFAQANWYAFGRLAWNHELTAEEIADEWIRMTFRNDEEVLPTIKSMMLGSWEACVNYMTPLGLHHIMKPGIHYGPAPGNDRGRVDWTSVYYHRADSIGLGFDRSSTGSNAVGQYFSPWDERFDNLETCPEKYLLWFHHVPWDYKLSSGRTLWNELNYRYKIGVDYVKGMRRKWTTLKGSVDPEIFEHVAEKLDKQLANAQEWEKVCTEYFQQFSGRPIPEFK